MAYGSWSIPLGDHRIEVRALREGRPRKVSKILVNGRRVSAINEKGEFFCNLVTGRLAFPVRLDGRALAILDDAAQFGLLPENAAKNLLKAHEKKQRAREQKWAAIALERDAKTLGVNLPSNIKRKVTQAKKAA